MFILNNINGVIVNGYDTDTVTQHGFALCDLSCDMREGVFGVSAKKKKKVKIQITLRRYILIRNLAIFCSVLQYPLISYAGSECPDQTARKRSLIRAFAAPICPKSRFQMARRVLLRAYSYGVISNIATKQ